MKYFIGVTLLLCLVLLRSFSDAKKGFQVGGMKIKSPKIPVAPKISLPKGPRFPFIVPIPIFLPVGNFRRLNSNERVNCYTCDGDEKSLCALNPAGNVNKVKCQSSYYCSTVRKEVNDDGISFNATQYNLTVSSNANQANIAVGLNETLVAASSSATNVTMDSSTELSTATTSSVEGIFSDSNGTTIAVWLNETIVAELPHASATNITVDSTIRRRGDDTRVIISRGCKRLDFVDGFALAQRSGLDANATERVYAQLCSSDLCNSGDGRLKCYECRGTGVDHPCMKTPTTVAKAVTCEWNEVCFVDRYIHRDDSTNATTNVIRVNRGCRRSSLTIEEEGKVISRDDKLSLSCRLSSFCNSFDANKLVRSSAMSGYQIEPYSILIGLLASFILGSRA